MEMQQKKVVLFGAGKIGREAAYILKKEGKEVFCFVDNDYQKWGKRILNIPVIGFEEYRKSNYDYEFIISCSSENRKQIVEQLIAYNITEVSCIDERYLLGKRERVISYSHPFDMEDVILYHVLYNRDKIFYIDIGSNDPFSYSVTKLFYDTKNAHGINVEPQKDLIKITDRERKRDVNLCVGVGNEPGEAEFFIQGECSTLVRDHVMDEECYSEKIKIITLSQICDKYIADNQEISFLKIDVEGGEKGVLEGANFEKYRPRIVVMESTVPNTLVPTHEQWEDILLKANYHHTFSYGVNRYYVANEVADDFDNRFIDVEELKLIYNIFYAKIRQ